MSKFKNHILNEYTSLHPKEKAIIMGQTKEIWLIEEGSVNLYVKNFINGQIIGKKKFLLSVSKGDYVFNLHSLHSADIIIIATGNEDLRIRKIPLNEVQELISTRENFSELCNALDKWITL